MPNDFISVVIPTRGRPELVTRAVESVLSQTHREVEILVVIDGPCAETTQSLAKITDARLRVIELPSPVGGSDTRNLGVQHAHGSWIAFLDDDDEWMPAKLERQLALARATEDCYPVISCKVIASSPSGQFVWPRRLPSSSEPICEYLFNRKSLFKGESLLQTSTLFAPRTLLEIVPFTSGLKRFQDYDWCLRAAEMEGVQFHFVPEPLVTWHIESGRESISNRNDWTPALEWLRSNRSRMTRRAYAGFISASLAQQASAQGDWRVAWQLLKEMFRNGRPGYMEISLFTAIWMTPTSLRRWLRTLLHPKAAQ